ncbi:hypothetical protein LINGRAPRIM_LOCUS2888 [Linum grandiflorum]
MIVMHEYPLGIVDHLYFKIFCNGLQPLFKVPYRNTTKAVRNPPATLVNLRNSKLLQPGL